MYGLLPRKGTLAVGADADVALWNPEAKVEITWSMLHDNVGYTPYEGRTLQGWPETVVSRGRVVIADGALHVERGSGQFIPRGAAGTRRTAAGADGGDASVQVPGQLRLTEVN